MDELAKMMQEFFAGEYDPLDFSFDLPDFLIDEHTNLEAENPAAFKVLVNDLPDICEEYERGADPAPFMAAVKREYEKALRAK